MNLCISHKRTVGPRGQNPEKFCWKRSQAWKRSNNIHFYMILNWFLHDFYIIFLCFFCIFFNIGHYCSWICFYDYSYADSCGRYAGSLPIETSKMIFSRHLGPNTYQIGWNQLFLIQAGSNWMKFMLRIYFWCLKWLDMVWQIPIHSSLI